MNPQHQLATNGLDTVSPVGRHAGYVLLAAFLQVTVRWEQVEPSR